MCVCVRMCVCMYVCAQTRNNGHGEDMNYGAHRVVLCMSTTPAPRAPKASHRLRADSLARRCSDFSGMAIRCCVCTSCERCATPLLLRRTRAPPTHPHTHTHTVARRYWASKKKGVSADVYTASASSSATLMKYASPTTAINTRSHAVRQYCRHTHAIQRVFGDT